MDEIETPKSLILLKKRCIRGCFLFSIIALIALLLAGIGVTVSHLKMLIGFSLFVAGMSLVALNHVKSRYHLLLNIISLPSVIYWMQERSMSSNLTVQALSGRQSFRVHLNIGEHIDVDILTDEIDYFKGWVDQRNHQVRWDKLYGGFNPEL